MNAAATDDVRIFTVCITEHKGQRVAALRIARIVRTSEGIENEV